jgi:hypothetical protein
MTSSITFPSFPHKTAPQVLPVIYGQTENVIFMKWMENKFLVLDEDGCR